MVPRGAHSSSITILQKHNQRIVLSLDSLQGDGRFESKYLQAQALLKANIPKQLADMKTKIVECQRGTAAAAAWLVRGETRSRKRGVIRITFKVGKVHFI